MRDSKPTIYDPSFLPTNIYGGTPTFMNLPVIENTGYSNHSDAYSLQTASHVGCWFALYTLNGIAERKANENK